MNAQKGVFWNTLIDQLAHGVEILKSGDKYIDELDLAEKIQKTDLRKIFKDIFKATDDDTDLMQNEEMYVILKDKGNDYLKTTTNDDKALLCYTEALYFCQKITSASFCHANRAAALIKLEFFKEAYDDCEAAINCGYPDQKIAKVYVRQAFCSVKLKDITLLKKSLSNLTKVQKTKDVCKIISEYEEELSKLQKDTSCSNTVCNQDIQIDSKDVQKEKRQKILSSDLKGRYVVADETIDVGEIIMAEKAFAFVPIVDPEATRSYHCETCGKTNIIPFPCYKCYLTSHCSLKCKEEAKEMHKFECAGLKRKILTEIGIGHLALKTFLTGIEQLITFIKEESKCNKLSRNEAWQLVNSFKNNNNYSYASIFQLNSDFNKLKEGDIKTYGISGVFLMYYLEALTKFFQSQLCKEIYKIITKSDWKIIVSAVLIRHLSQMVLNAHTVSAFVFESGKVNLFKRKDKTYIGQLNLLATHRSVFAAIYPRISMYNHSCEPSFYNKFSGTKLYVVSTTKIRKNQEIFNSYGINFKLSPRTERINVLKEQYNFICDCVHCSNDDDTGFKKHHSLRCVRDYCRHVFCGSPRYIETNIKCPGCQRKIETRWLGEWLAFYASFKTGNVKPSEQDMQQIFKTYQLVDYFCVGDHVGKHFMMSDYTVIANKFLMEAENVSNSVCQNILHVAQKNLEIAENVYGLKSLEYIKCASIFLDIVALMKNKYLFFKLNYSMDKILESFEILPDETKTIFVNYFVNVSDMLKE